MWVGLVQSGEGSSRTKTELHPLQLQAGRNSTSRRPWGLNSALCWVSSLQVSHVHLHLHHRVSQSLKMNQRVHSLLVLRPWRAPAHTPAAGDGQQRDPGPRRRRRGGGQEGVKTAAEPLRAPSCGDCVRGSQLNGWQKPTTLLERVCTWGQSLPGDHGRGGQSPSGAGRRPLLSSRRH